MATPTNISPSILASSSMSGLSFPPSVTRKMSGMAAGATTATDPMVIQLHRAAEQSIILHVVKPPLDASKLAQALYQLSQQVRQATSLRHAAIVSGSPSAMTGGPVANLPLARTGSGAVTHTPPWTPRSGLATVSEYPTTTTTAEQPDHAVWSDMAAAPTPLITRSESFSLLWGEPRNVRSMTASPLMGAGTPGSGTVPPTTGEGGQRRTPTAYDESPPVSPGAMPGTVAGGSGRMHPIPTRSTHEYRPSLVAREMTMGLARYRPVPPSPSAAEVEPMTSAPAPGTPVTDRTRTPDMVGPASAAASASTSGAASPTNIVSPPGMVPSLSSLGPIPSPPPAVPTTNASTTADLVQQKSELPNYPSLPPLFRQTHSSPGRLVRVVPPIHVLIVEDNPINARILSAFMERRRIRYMLAGDGAQAVALFARHTFHIVLMDLQLPRMGGLEATQQIRAWERAHARGAWPSNQPTLQDLRRHLHLDRGSSAASLGSGHGQTTTTAATAAAVHHAAAAASPQHVAAAVMQHAPLQARTSVPSIIVAITASQSTPEPVNLKWLESKIIEWGCIAKLIDFCTTEPASGKWVSSQRSREPAARRAAALGHGPAAPHPLIPEVVPSVSAGSGMHAAAGRGIMTAGAGVSVLHQYMPGVSGVTAADVGKTRQRTSSDPESVLGMEQVAAVRRSVELHRSRTPSA
ncbi:hypothetical protein AMAG_19211 [Allomyces macrogynus ATCC 38327]|uniref:Response regulatory domain-containing protein n=1 Tax=Allomyces macrogynus (strain ATCC 38327) TaxID=578462 RepID=A0A0L0STW7_ALLM3|nr:hypothetical protein AMAG_19211 [Allomyces macrogynus ATCC 38327]|eukprot:KNE65779.1 hypothetical protein AMAG_19211 [Allomyces macrogynus ATCC 38327]